MVGGSSRWTRLVFFVRVKPFPCHLGWEEGIKAKVRKSPCEESRLDHVLVSAAGGNCLMESALIWIKGEGIGLWDPEVENRFGSLSCTKSGGP